MGSISKDFTTSGTTVGLRVARDDKFSFSISGTFTGLVAHLEQSESGLSWLPISSYTGTQSATQVRNEDRARSSLMYRFRVSAIASGTATITLDDVAVDLIDQGKVKWENKDGQTIMEIKEDGVVLLNPITITGLTANGVVTTNSSSQLASTALTHGQIMMGSTGAAPVAGLPTAGTGISVTGGPGSLTIAATPGAGVGTMCDVYSDTTKILDNAENLRFDSDNFGVTASGTTAKFTVKDKYDATFIVGAGSDCTHATASGAYAAGSALSSYRIAFKAEDHALAAKLAIVTTGKRIAIVATGAKLTLAAGVDDNAVEVTGTGSLEWDGGIIDQGKAGQSTGNGLHINVGTARIRTRNLIVQNAKVKGIYYTDGAAGADVEFNTTEANTCDSDGWYATNILGATLNKCRASSNAGYGFTEHTSAGTVTYNDCIGSSNLIGLYSPSLTRTVVNGGQYFSNTADGIQIETQGSVQNARVFSNGANGIIAQNTDQFSISNNEVYLNTQHGILVNGASLNAAVDDNQIYENGRCGIACNNTGGGGVAGLSIGNNGIHGNSTSAANTYSGIYLDDATKCVVDGNVITGANHKYGIEETATSDYNTIEGNNIFDATTGEMLVLGANSKVLDTCVVTGTITRDAATGAGDQTITGLGTGSCPNNFEFYAHASGSTAIFSRGGDDGTFYNCMWNDGAALDSDHSASFHVENAATSGYAGRITVFGAAGGTAQDQFTIGWTLAPGGAGVGTHLHYRAWR